MKNLRIRVTLVLTLLIALGAAFGMVTAPFVHAATTHTTPVARKVIAVPIAPIAHTASAAIRPNINSVGCGDPQFFTIYSIGPTTPTPGGGGVTTTCFANAGYTSWNISSAYAICTGNNAGQVLLQNPYVWLVEPQHNTCYGFNYATILAVQIY